MQEPTSLALTSPASRYAAATRPGFLTAAAVPVFIGLAMSHPTSAVGWFAALLTLIGAVAAHAGINVLNDYYDDRAGCDAINDDRVFPFTGGSRIIQNQVLRPDQMAWFGWLLFATAAVIGIVLTGISGWGLIAIGLAGLFLGWAYSAPPFRLCGRGLGEVTVGLGFGTLIPVGTAYVQLGEVSMAAAAAGLPYAFLIALVLYINQFPDWRADAASGKRNLVVRLGPQAARAGYPVIAAGAYVSLVVVVAGGWVPAGALLGLVALPLHLKGLSVLWRHATEPAQLRPAIEATLNGTMVHGLAMVAGLILSDLFLS
jgi:1,4-dihydroxy-2-naphthoate octaprenyltransferase